MQPRFDALEKDLTTALLKSDGMFKNKIPLPNFYYF